MRIYNKKNNCRNRINMIRLRHINDTEMINLSSKQQRIICIILRKGFLRSSDIYAEMIKNNEDISLVTIKRALSEMTKAGCLMATGQGRSTNYNASVIGRILADINAKEYCAVEPDKRYGINRYNFDLFAGMPADIFFENELKTFDAATAEYENRTQDVPMAIQKKELERLIIELSWKSSKIEGNTYTLLDTEKLILENKEAAGHDKKESLMILNHKDAFNYIHKNSTQFKSLTKKNLEELHAILAKDLNVGFGLREKLVGVIGSKYQPLDNVHQIKDAIEALSALISKMQTPYAKALIALIGISYIQPFEDGNKRTARLMANAVLLAHKLAPLSYRSVEENEFREAMLVFYEINSIIPMKRIFIEQYNFAARNYAVK